jgi:hypothetical protein
VNQVGVDDDVAGGDPVDRLDEPTGVLDPVGERLEVLKDYPTPPNCTSPFAPIWINEMVRRQPLK